MNQYEVTYTDSTRDPRIVEARSWVAPDSLEPLAHIQFFDSGKVVLSIARFAVESIEWKRDSSEHSGTQPRQVSSDDA